VTIGSADAFMDLLGVGPVETGRHPSWEFRSPLLRTRLRFGITQEPVQISVRPSHSDIFGPLKPTSKRNPSGQLDLPRACSFDILHGRDGTERW
jgi:hypothetical protein